MDFFVQIIQSPKPLPSKRVNASFLEHCADSSVSVSKRYRPESVDPFVTQWVESLSELETFRARHCRSEILFGRSDGDVIPRRLTKSASTMECRQDADGFILPMIPASALSREESPQIFRFGEPVPSSSVNSYTTGSSPKTGTANPIYREGNLGGNGIHIRSFYENLPENIAGLVDQIRKDRDSPGLLPDQVNHNRLLECLEMGVGEPDVENYFQNHIFLGLPPLDSLQRTNKTPMAKHAVPDLGYKLKVSTPVPDLLYGYNPRAAFSQEAQLHSIENSANTLGLRYPFFVIEFKADGPGKLGSLWAATNQCLGSSASCLNIIERLNSQLRQYTTKEIQTINNAVFSIAMNGTEARLYVSWIHNEFTCYTQKIASFLLQEPQHYQDFRKHVLNIIDWGRDKHLKEIRTSLDRIIEEERKIASQKAKFRPPPSPDNSASIHDDKRMCLRSSKARLAGRR